MAEAPFSKITHYNKIDISDTTGITKILQVSALLDKRWDSTLVPASGKLILEKKKPRLNLALATSDIAIDRQPLQDELFEHMIQKSL